MNAPLAPLRLFIGFDSRQPLAYNVAAYSALGNSSTPLAITPLFLRTLPLSRRGLTEFTFSRYLVPCLCGYEGFALFVDADVVFDADVAELFSLANYGHSVMVSPAVARFERPAVMLFNCAACRTLTPDFVERGEPHTLDWAGELGYFPPEWAVCVGYNHRDFGGPDQPRPKLIHYTAGIPIWPETRDSAFADIWHKYHRGMNASVSYNDLMANSVHHKKVVSGEIRDR